MSGFGFGGANAHLVVREVLPSDLVEPEPAPEAVAGEAEPTDADAVYVGGVRMDEYGEFIHDDDDEPTATTTSTPARTATPRTSPNCPA